MAQSASDRENVPVNIAPSPPLPNCSYRRAAGRFPCPKSKALKALWLRSGDNSAQIFKFPETDREHDKTASEPRSMKPDPPNARSDRDRTTSAKGTQ